MQRESRGGRRSALLGLLALLSLTLLGAHGQTFPQFQYTATGASSPTTLPNNSFIDRARLGTGDSAPTALMCVTDNTGCCTDPDEGGWTDEQGMTVSESASADLYVTRGDRVVRLNRDTGGSSGMWRCDIPDSSGETQHMYIYTGDSSTGELTSASVSFSALHTEPNVSPPEFTLSCRSEGGPATAVSWQRNGQPVEEDSDHETSQIIVDTAADTVYESRLRVRGREGGGYQCTVSSNRDDFFGATGSMATSTSFTVQVAGQPTRVFAVPLSDTSIDVRWDSPGDPATSYVIYYQPNGGEVSSVEVTGGDTESQQLDDLESGVTYSVSIVALSDHLPSAVVGPVTPSALEPPTVTLTAPGSGMAGSSLTLTCTVTLPTGVTDTPTVQWEGPGLSATGSVEGSGSTYTSQQTLNPLTLSQAGDYTCTATYTASGETSPEGRDTVSVSVSIPPPSLTVGIDGSEVPYVGNDITVVCGVQLSGVADGGDVDVAVRWMKDGSEFTGVSGRVTIIGPIGSGAFVQSIMTFSHLLSSDSGRYECEATVTALQGTSSPSTASQDMNLTVVDPTVIVETSPPSVRVPDESPYNQFTVTCTARAEVEGETVPLEVTVEWTRQAGSGSASDVSSAEYETTGSAEDGYQSILNTTETDTQNPVTYRCRAALSVDSSVQQSDGSVVTVVGPTNPVTPDPVSAIDIRDNRATIQWTVPSIAYTPETYVVEYGTSQGSLDLTSDSQHSGPDITATDVTYSVQLSNLEPLTTYHYRVVATNTADRSTASGVLMFMTTARRTDPPQSFQSTLQGGVTYSFSWEAPANLYGTQVLDYTVTCDPTLEGVPVRMDTTTSTSLTLELGYGLTYSCQVTARNSAGPSDPATLSSTIATVESAPSGAPENIQIEPSSRNLSLSWEPPSPAERNGMITGYTVQCVSATGSPFSVGTSDQQLTATGLTPNTTYNCSISARNGQGVGPSTYQIVNTLEAPPDAPPRDFSHTVVDGAPDVMFTWSPPPEDTTNGAITHYTITCDSGSGEETQSSSDLELTISSLTPGTRYNCTISASTTAGEGPQSDPMPVLTVPSAPRGLTLSAVSFSEAVGLLAEWSREEEEVTNYTVLVTALDRERDVEFSTSDTRYTIESEAVGGYERVSVEVVAVNDAGYGPASEGAEERTPPIIPGAVGGLSFTGVGDDSVNVTWQRPDYPNGIISGYLVTVGYYQSGRGQISTTDTGNDTLSATIRHSSLEPGVPYNGSVVAVNQVGEGQGQPQLFYTRELASGPVQLVGDPVRSSSGDAITVTWRAPDLVESRGIITQYQIEFSEATGGSSRRRRQACQTGGCALPAGATEGCCEVPYNQTSATITDLDPSKAYSVTVSAGNGAGQGESSEPVTAQPNETDEEAAGFPIIAVIGAVIGAAVVALAVVIVIVVILLLCRRGKRYNYERSISPSDSQEKARLDSAKPLSGGELTSFSAFAPVKTEEENERMRPIPIDQFSEHVRQMHQDRDKGFEVEYQSISNDPVAAYDESKVTANKPKNRFANIFPYDDSRVPLSEIAGVEGSTYINASYIDGYQHKEAYIAAQGPLPNTVTDFWRMIWEQQLNTIVMLTKGVEHGKRKCEIYWADTVGETFKAGAGIAVKYQQQMPFADYEIRIFHVTHIEKPHIPPLEVTHFQFLSWPDHGVPQYATALIGFIRRVRRDHREGKPILVHCSAGVGRTGTYILLDNMLERIAHEKTINAYEFLVQMRRKRAQMVQTLAQYVFIHDALEELITCGDTAISSSNLRIKMGKMHKIIQEKAISGFSDQFKLLEKVSRQPSEGECSDALQPYNQEKNRYPDRVPYNMSRVRLRPTGVTGAEYINASFLDGYKHRSAYIATQAPLEATTNDFWRMMWEFKSRAIVMLCRLEENGEVMSHSYWPIQPNVKEHYGKCYVTLTSEEGLQDAPEVTVRKFDITDDKNTTTLTITQYHLTEWPERGRVSPSTILKLINHLTRTQQNTGNRAITVTCNDGMGRTGTFICVHAMLERMKTEGVADFFQFIKASRINRPNMVTAQEHYILCHDTVADYIDSFDTYANFRV